jgi:hypothetical protein
MSFITGRDVERSPTLTGQADVKIDGDDPYPDDEQAGHA